MMNETSARTEVTAEPLLGAVTSCSVAIFPPRLDTKIIPCFGERATANGALPTFTVCMMARWAVSITAMWFMRLMATYATVPSAEKAMPQGRG